MPPLNCLAFAILNQALHITLMWGLLENIIARNEHSSTLLSKTKQSWFSPLPLAIRQLHNVCCLYRPLKGKKIWENIPTFLSTLYQLKNTYWKTKANAAFFVFLGEQWMDFATVDSYITPQTNVTTTPHPTHKYTQTCTRSSLWIISMEL